MAEDDHPLSRENLLLDPKQSLSFLPLCHQLQLSLHRPCGILLHSVHYCVRRESEGSLLILRELAGGTAVEELGADKLLNSLETKLLLTGHVHFVDEKNKVFEVLDSESGVPKVSQALMGGERDAGSELYAAGGLNLLPEGHSCFLKLNSHLGKQGGVGQCYDYFGFMILLREAVGHDLQVLCLTPAARRVGDEGCVLLLLCIL